MALSSIKVLDLSRVLAGPLASQALGDMGASVINIEHPSRGEITRHWGPPFVDTSTSDRNGNNKNISAYFCTVNRNKHPFSADLRDPQSLSTVHHLARQADVILQNFLPGQLEKYHLDYSSIAKTNPRAIYASISGYGLSGPRASEPGFDFCVQASSGLMSFTGPKGTGSYKFGSAIVDVAAGNYLVQGILAALYHRDAAAGGSGKGQHISVSLWDSALAIAANRPVEYLNGGSDTSVEPLGNSHPTIAPYDNITVGIEKPNSTRQVVIAAGTDGQFKALAQLIGLDETAMEHQYKNNPMRVANRNMLLAEIEEKVKDCDDPEAFVQSCVEAGIPASLINTIPEALEQSPHMIVNFPAGHDNANEITVVANPIQMSDTPITYRIAPQPLGRFKNEEILQLWR